MFMIKYGILPFQKLQLLRVILRWWVCCKSTADNDLTERNEVGERTVQGDQLSAPFCLEVYCNLSLFFLLEGD